MQKKSRSNSVRVTRRTFAAGAGAAAFVAGAAPFNIVRAQAGRSKVGVFCRVRLEAGIGQDCQRGVDYRAGDLQVDWYAGTHHHHRRY